MVDVRDLHVLPSNDLSRVYVGTVDVKNRKWTSTCLDVTDEVFRLVMVMTGPERTYTLSSGAEVKIKVELVKEADDKVLGKRDAELRKSQQQEGKA